MRNKQFSSSKLVHLDSLIYMKFRAEFNELSLIVGSY